MGRKKRCAPRHRIRPWPVPSTRVDGDRDREHAADRHHLAGGEDLARELAASIIARPQNDCCERRDDTAPVDGRVGQRVGHQGSAREWTGPSTACHAHMTCDGGFRPPALDDEIMALGLARDRLRDRPSRRSSSRRRAQRGAQIGRVLLAKAHIKRSGARDPHAIAALAEIMRERRDEAQDALRFP